MTETTPDADGETLFETASAAERESLRLQLGAYEGPLDVLLDLARSHKIELTQISMLALAEQYLAFFNAVRRARLDIAAEYLVMAAWLTYLKSRSLLPKQQKEDDEPSGEEMAAYLAFQLERLAGLRRAAEDLFARPRLGEQVFARGEPERRRVTTSIEWTATQHELLMAYARQRTKANFTPLHLDRREVVAIDQAILRLRAALGPSARWEKLIDYLPDEWRDQGHVRSAVASTFAAALELAKHGQVELRQEGPFEPLFITRREGARAYPAEDALEGREAEAETPDFARRAAERERPRRRRGDAA